MPERAEVISHWHHSVEDFGTSTMAFYASVEETLRAKEAPFVRTERVDWHESGMLSARREYLRVSFSRYSFDICAAPFGKDYFFSWWLTKRRHESALAFGCAGMIGLVVVLWLFVKVAGVVAGLLLFVIALVIGIGALASAALPGIEIVEDAILALPVVGFLYARFLKPVTYFAEDSRLIFEEAVHTVVLHEVEALLKAKGARALAPEEAKPQGRPLIS